MSIRDPAELSRSELVRWVKEVLRRYCVRPSRKLGQHFLVEPSLLRDIERFSDLRRDDVVFEIGGGTGVLTAFLAFRVKRVITIEIDKRLVEALRELSSALGNVEVIEGDVLEYEIPRVNKIVADIPYSITSPLLEKLLLEWRGRYEVAVLTLQHEVGERLIAAPGTKEYGRLTVFCNLFSEITYLRRIPRNFFYPIPEVDSALIKIVPRSDVPEFNYNNFRDLVTYLFTQRNKLVKKVLSEYIRSRDLRINVDELPSELINRRVRDLRPLDFIELVKYLKRT